MKIIRRWIVLCFLLLTSCGGQSSLTSSEGATPPSLLKQENLQSEYIEWHGRHLYQEDAMYFYHTATGFKISFFGRVISIDFLLTNRKMDIYYAVSKDGQNLLDGPRYIQRTATDSYTVTYDTYAHHTLEMVKQSEPQDGVTAITKFETNGYFVTMGAHEIKPHFLCIGASGISGHGALGQANQSRTTENSSSLHSFGYLTAAAYQGTYEFVAQSGWGLAFGYNDTTGTQSIGRAIDYIGIDADEKIIEQEYSYSTIPDFVIVNIGGNDYSAVINRASGFDKNNKILVFKQAVASLLLKLRTTAPNAHIFWTMTTGSLNGTAANEVIAQLSQQDRQYVHSVIIKQVGEDGDPIGANNHCSYISHQKSAQNIIDAIESIASNR